MYTSNRTSKSLIFFIPFILCFALGVSCKSTNEVNGDTQNSKDSITIVSLSPSTTEIVGVFKSSKVQLIGKTDYCNYPSSILSVQTIQTFPLDVEKIIALKPDYVLVKKDLIKSIEKERLKSFGIEVLDLSFETIDDIKSSLVKIGNVIQADSIQLNTYIRNITQLNPNPLDTFSYIAFASVKPYYVYGQSTYFSQLARFEGGINLVEKTTQSYPEYDLEKIILSNPDVLFVSDSINYKILLTQSQFKNMYAVKNKRIYCLPADIMTRPGARMDSLRYWIHKSTHNE